MKIIDWEGKAIRLGFHSEKDMFQSLRAWGWSSGRMAELLGVDRSTISWRLKKIWRMPTDKIKWQDKGPLNRNELRRQAAAIASFDKQGRAVLHCR